MVRHWNDNGLMNTHIAVAKKIIYLLSDHYLNIGIWGYFTNMYHKIIPERGRFPGDKIKAAKLPEKAATKAQSS